MSGPGAAPGREDRIEAARAAFAPLDAFDHADRDTLFAGAPEALRAALDHPRFYGRLRARAARRFGFVQRGRAPRPVETRLYRAGPEAVSGLCRRAGVARYAAAALRIADARILRAASAAFGLDIREEALRWRAGSGAELAPFSGGGAPDALQEIAEPEALAALLRREGAACWLSWLHEASESVRAPLLAMTPAALRRDGAAALSESGAARGRAAVIAELLRRDREEAERET